MLHPRAWNLSPWSGTGDRSVPGSAESCGSPRAAGQSSQDGTGRWHGSAGRTASATPPYSLSKDKLPRGVPSLKDERFLLESLSQKLSPLSPVPQASRLAIGRDQLVQEALWHFLCCPLFCPHRPLSRPSLVFLELPLGTRCARPCPRAASRDYFCSPVHPGLRSGTRAGCACGPTPGDKAGGRFLGEGTGSLGDECGSIKAADRGASFPSFLTHLPCYLSPFPSVQESSAPES